VSHAGLIFHTVTDHLYPIFFASLFLGTVTDGEFGSLRTKGENRPLHLWQIIHDAKELARKMSKKLLIGCLELKSGIDGIVSCTNYNNNS
jgi:hypothetical protein